MTIRTLIVDDERLAREKVRMLLASDSDIEIAGECANATEAVAAIKQQKPDLLLLDIGLPGENGFDILRKLRGQNVPSVIFITAHAEYAVRAFEVAAVDYVLKPIDRKRFNEALRRVKQRLSDGIDDTESRVFRLVERALATARSDAKRLDHFVVKSRDRTFLVPYSDVEWIQAEGKYVRVHTNDGGAHLVRDSITDVEERLDARRFLRIHRGTIVNVRRIAEMHRGFGGGLFVVLRDGTKLTMSRRFRAQIREMTGLDV
jgi:two-component system, LytTR family, response regulator